jgi:uncharacterized surface protein with fasciclin (FAS1) repeats
MMAMSTSTSITSFVAARHPTRTLARLAVVAIATLMLGACASSATSSSDTVDVTKATEAATNATIKAAAIADTTLPPLPSKTDVFTTAESSGKYPTFVNLVNQAGLAETLKTGGPFTIVIPTEEAFTALPKETLASLEANKDELARVLKYHVVPGLIEADPAASGPAPTLEGSTIEVLFTPTSATINGALILTSPQPTSNGAYVAINKVLLPPQK